MYGNMSAIEKAFNKHDMQAYKNYDGNQYSLVPGLQHAKHDSPQAKSLKAAQAASPAKDSPKATGLLNHDKALSKQDQLFQMGYNDMGMMMNRADSNKLPINASNRITRVGAGGLPDKGLHLDDALTKNQHYDKVPLGGASVNISEQERRLLAASDVQPAARYRGSGRQLNSSISKPDAPSLHGPEPVPAARAPSYNILNGQEMQYPSRNLHRGRHSAQVNNLAAAGMSIIQ